MFASCFACDDKFFWLEDVYGNITSSPTPYFLEELEVGAAYLETLDCPFTVEEVKPADCGAFVKSEELEVEVREKDQHSSGSTSTPNSAEEDIIPDPDPEPVRVRDNADVIADMPDSDSSSADLSDGLEKDDTDETKDNSDMFDALDEMEKEETDLQTNGVADSALLDKAHDPNPEQQAAISLPLDSAARVIAPPGAGKTFLLVRRLRHLVDQGVDIRNIGAVAFNVKMAETLRVRFLQLMPSDWDGRAEVERNISTIHAMCFRMLKESGDRRRIPERAFWKIKKFIQDFVVERFPNVDEQPNHKEILSWIYISKNRGVPIGGLETFYFGAMGDGLYGVFMRDVHNRYTEFMRENNWLMFGDMLYDVEMKLINDPAFRNHWQQT